MQSKEAWQMTIEELTKAAQGGKIDPFGGVEDEMVALCSGAKPVIFDNWPQTVDKATFEKIVNAWFNRKPTPCANTLFVAPIADSDGIIGLTIALSKKTATVAATEIVELPHDASYDARMGKILGYSDADIAAWYLNMRNHVDAFLRFAGGHMDKATIMFERFCAGLSLEQAIDIES
ncbi:MAG: hypothetical protein JRJ12_02820 [Deltaproteobacteria bacterium]|nr:hypothetical protein [Deltaproteobacteria bacterium]MBW2071527.1 hypothetical protein [Deltaproteobacteria bacterium]